MLQAIEKPFYLVSDFIEFLDHRSWFHPIHLGRNDNVHRRATQRQYRRTVLATNTGETGCPASAFCPTIEALIDRVPVAETFRQIAPCRAASGDKQDSVDEQAVILGGASDIGLLARTLGRDFTPQLRRQFVTMHSFSF